MKMSIQFKKDPSFTCWTVLKDNIQCKALCGAKCNDPKTNNPVVDSSYLYGE